jgi:uncharacterized membrane protein
MIVSRSRRGILLLFFAAANISGSCAFSIGSKIFYEVQRHRSNDPVAPTTDQTLSLARSAKITGRCFSSSRDVDEKPDPSILISSKDDLTQQLVFFSAFALLAAGTNLCINLWHGPGLQLLGTQGYAFIRETIFPIAFGAIFALVGVAHFVFVENFARIVPPPGTWGGLWNAPAPFAQELGVSYEEYHSYWSGIVEFVGGIWLLAGGLGLTSSEEPANLLFLLTIAVTPANLYMFTHDAEPGGSAPRLEYPWGHFTRFIIQCGLLSNFWIMAHA